MERSRVLSQHCCTMQCSATYAIAGFTRFVEIGRVCLINYGPETGKLCTIIDVADKNKLRLTGSCGSRTFCTTEEL
eukprot:16629-Heterococcus_DN1.PRE.6